MADRGLIESRRRSHAGKPVGAEPKPKPAQFDFSTVLGIADAIPMLIAFVDTGQRYRFINQALAEWFEQPRSEILGRTVREVLGEATYSSRAPMIEAALGGERQWFAADYEHPTRGALAVQTVRCIRVLR